MSSASITDQLASRLGHARPLGPHARALVEVFERALGGEVDAASLRSLSLDVARSLGAQQPLRLVIEDLTVVRELLQAEGTKRGADDAANARLHEVIDRFAGRVVEEYTHARELLLQRAQRRTLDITNNATLGLVLMDASQHCVFLNPAAEQIFGYTLEQVRGKPLHDFIHHTRPDGRPYPMAECPIDRALPERFQTQGEEIFVRPDGTFYPVAFTASPILEDGRPSGTVIEVRDVTEEKQAAHDREELLRELQEAVRVRDEFLSIASHELRTPLTTLKLVSDGLLRSSPEELPAEALQTRLRTLRRQVSRLDVLVSELLDVSRLQGGHFSLELEAVDLVEVAKEVVERFVQEASRSGVALTLEAPAPVRGRWDRLRLDQVITNLVANAVKYGAGRPVEVRVHTRGGEGVLEVHDSGIGIAPEDQARIFERFERAVSRNYGGLGLGLWISRRIVEAHEGRIELESAPGQGATFRVILPRR